MKYPLISVTIAFALGILSLDIVQVDFGYLSILIFLFLGMAVLLHHLRPDFVYIPVLAASFFLGTIRIDLASEKLPLPLFNDYFIRGIEIHGRVSSFELPVRGALSFSVELDSVTSSGETFLSGKKILVSLYEDSGEIYNDLQKIAPGFRVSLLGNYYRLRSEANPYAFDEESYYQKQGFSGRFRITKPDSSTLLSGSGFVYERFVHNFRRSADSSLRSLFSQELYALLRGLLLADRGEVDLQTRKEFSQAGVIHVLAVSGLHMSFIAFLFSLLLTRLGRLKRDIGTIIGILLFLALTGFVTTATRAGIMIILFLAGRILQKDPYPVHTVFVAAFLILLWNPFEIYTAGFQLSFSAVIGILLFMKPLEESFRIYKVTFPFLKASFELMLVSVSALLGIFPFLLFHFGNISLISPVSNLLVIPLTGLIIAGGLASSFLSFFFSGVALNAASVTEVLYELLTGTVSFFASAGFLIWKIEKISIPILIAMCFLAGLIYHWLVTEDFSKGVRMVLAGLTLTVIFVISQMSGSIFEKGKMDVLFFDVGQGDAILVSTPGGEKWLIDGGVLNSFSNAGTHRIIPFLERTKIGKIDYALVSHYDTDHFGGIAVLLKESIIRTIILPPKEPGYGADDALEKLALLRGVNIISAKDTAIHSGGGVFYLLTPSGGQSEGEKKSNERSISLKLVYGKTAFLFTGDAPDKTEENLINKFGAFLDSDVLKAGHHGSKSSTGEKLLKRVSPEVVVFSSGLGNGYNHPAKEVILRSVAEGANVARTDFEGALLFTSDGLTVTKRLWK